MMDTKAEVSLKLTPRMRMFRFNRNRLKRLIRYYAREIVLVMGSLFLLMFVAAIISEFESEAHGRVQAVESGQTILGLPSQKVQTGLMAVVSGVAKMQQYADHVRFRNVAGGRNEVLAGAAGVDRTAIYQTRMQEGTAKAADVLPAAMKLLQKNQLSQDEYQTLLKITEAEATGGDVKSKMLVARVVLNRVADERFPDTIQEVVYQRLQGYPQFQPVSDGRLYSVQVTESTVEAVERVLSGEDPSEGALFFMARESAAARNLEWFDNTLEPLFEYGGHEYFTFADEA